MVDIDWSESPKDAQGFMPASNVWMKGWWKQENDCFYFWPAELGRDGGWKKTYANPFSHALFNKRPTTQPAAWNGEGLPPVGAACEAKSMARGVERDWFNATVLYSSPYTVVLDDYQAGEFVAHPATMQFRPIRTPEQIAADEREAAVNRIYDILEGSKRPDLMSTCRALYDAGLRFKDDAQ
jgi:hypothetical protein